MEVTSREHALKTACEALAAGLPFDLAILTTNRLRAWEVVGELEGLWKVDPDLQVIVQPGPNTPKLSDSLSSLEHPDNVFLLRQAATSDELHQMVRALISKRRKAVSSRVQMRTLESRNMELQTELGESRFTENRLAHAATHDSLTGLPNREFIRQRIAECAIEHSEESNSALLFLDLDNFKYVNDSLGHNIGDALLVQFASRLRAVEEYRASEGPGQETYVARLGGDEFVLLLKGLDDSQDTERIAHALQRHLTEGYALDGHDVRIGVSIGIAFFGEGITAPEQLMRNADMAMYRAKFGGKQCIAVFDNAMQQATARRIMLENELRGAIRRNAFSLHHQPIFSLSTNEPVAVESLMRWKLADGSDVSPDEFIPIAEETGLIVPIGKWVIREALRTVARINQSRQENDQLSISVNVAKRQLLDPHFIQFVEECLLQSGQSGKCLNIEITEHVVLDGSKHIQANLETLRRLGVRIFLDDFGTGHSSLTCLHKFPIDVVKIDRSFVSTMESNEHYACIVGAIVTLAHRLGASVIAEGVETQQHVDQLKALECDWGQGYHFSRPLSKTALAELCGEEECVAPVPPPSSIGMLPLTPSPEPTPEF